jgi:hypothetical protein
MYTKVMEPLSIPVLMVTSIKANKEKCTSATCNYSARQKNIKNF